jgi:hypothetical protein
MGSASAWSRSRRPSAPTSSTSARRSRRNGSVCKRAESGKGTPPALVTPHPGPLLTEERGSGATMRRRPHAVSRLWCLRGDQVGFRSTGRSTGRH